MSEIETTATMLYLGNLPPLDPIEGTGNYTAENASSLLGTYTHKDAPLQLVAVTQHDANGNGTIADDSSGQTADTMSYNLGSGSVSSKLDTEVLYNATITYRDGTTATTQLAVAQLQNGATFVVFGNSDLSNANIGSIDFTSVSGNGYNGVEVTTTSLTGTHFLCLTAGTRLLTHTGARLVESLAPGDLLWTFDLGWQPLLWVGRQTAQFGPRTDPARPILFRAGSLGHECPSHDLAVSPLHRMCLPGDRKQGAPVSLAPARALLSLTGVRQMTGKAAVEYFSLLMPHHSLLMAEGALVESFYPGPVALAALRPDQRADVLAHIPTLATDPIGGYGPFARPPVTRRAAERMIAQTSRLGAQKQSASQPPPAPHARARLRSSSDRQTATLNAP
jgi:hypothetical protein